MSITGEFARLTPKEVDEIRRDATTARERLWQCDLVNIERTWDVLRFLMDADGCPVNVISDGVPYPDEEHSWGWGWGSGSRCLSVDQVRVAAAYLARTPFEALTAHMDRLRDPHLEVYARENWLDPVGRPGLASHYWEMVEFFQDAAANGQQTVWWSD